MKDETRDRSRDLSWALPASLILHGLIVAVLVYGQPMLPHLQQEEPAVNVTLVPPPEQPKPKPAPPPAPNESKAEKPPEPKEPKAEKPPEPKAEQPPPSEVPPPMPAPIEVLKPVFRFGDKDAGSSKSLEGGIVQNSSPSPAKGDDSKPPLPAKGSQNEAATSPGSEERPDAASDTEKQATAAKDTESAQDAENDATLNQDIGKQETDKQEGLVDGADKQTAMPPTPLDAAGSDGEIALPALAKAPQPRPATAPKSSFAKASKPKSGSSGTPNSKDVDVATSQPYSGLPGVRRPQSQGVTGDALATTSMAGVPRDQRVAKLCASTLQQQLMQASYYPDLVPSLPLKLGNVLDVPKAHFRTRTTWHALSFRCEVDTDATSVLSFSFRVGATIPREQWARLGLPTGF